MKQTTWHHFLLLWSTQSISIVGSSLTRYALIIWVYQQQGSVSSIAWLSILPALILSKTKNNTKVLALVTSSIGIGALTGSLLSALAKEFKHKTTIIFLACALSFLCFGIPLALSTNPYIWILAAFLSNLPLPFLNANLTTIMRLSIPIEMQGRIFSTRDTIQFITIPLGLALGGYVSDSVFEPLMSYSNTFSDLVSPFLGFGKGSGIALIFLLCAIVGTITSLVALTSKSLRSLNIETPES